MLYIMENNRLTKMDAGVEGMKANTKYVGIFSIEEAETVLSKVALPQKVFEDIIQNPSARFESRENFDLVCTGLLEYHPNTSPQKKSFLSIQKRNYILLKEDLLFFFCEKPEIAKRIIDKLVDDEISDISLDRLLCSFFDWLTRFDSRYLEVLEKTVTNLEDEIILNRQEKNYIKNIITLRKHLLVQKRYYEQLLDIFAYLGENENQLFKKPALRCFKILSARTDRLYHNVLSLRDYVTQIREAYQAEVDINLNTTMKLFTVITTIFLPLSLIAGWYGMNFDMPEYHSPLGYPIVIMVSILVVVISIAYFKKNRWF